MSARRRHRGRALLWTLSCALLLPSIANAQSAQVTLETQQQRITTDDQLVIRATARGQYEALTPPTSEGFDFRSRGHSTQVSIIGNQMQRSEQYTWVGTPRRKGKWKITPVVARYRGREVARSKTLVIEVLDGRATMGPAVSPDKATDLSNFAGEAFFVRPILSTDKPFVGQPFVAEFQLFWSQNAGVQDISKRGDPSYEGLTVEDLLAGEQPSQESVRFAGRRYVHQVVAKALLTAANPGSYELVGPRFQIQAGDIFSSRTYKIAARPIAIKVQALPEQGRPDGYLSGSIGRLKMRAFLGKRGAPTQSIKIKAGERTVFTVEVEGMGNLLGLPELSPAPLQGMFIEKLPSRPDQGLKMGPNGAEGKRTWQYILSFSAGGRYEIPALTWSVFDPFEEKYEEQSAGPFVIEVEGPSATPPPKTAGAASISADPDGSKVSPPRTKAAQPGTTVRTSGSPNVLKLRPIAPRAKLADHDLRPWTDSPWFWRLASLPWLLFGLLLLLRLGLKLRAQNAPTRQVAGALALAHRQLREASEQSPETGYAQLGAAVDTYLKTLADLNVVGLTWAGIQTKLRALGVDTELASSLTDLLEHCDFARFAPGGDRSGDLEKTATQLGAVLQRIDQAHAAQMSKRKGQSASRAAAGLLTLTLLAAPSWGARAATLDESFAKANGLFVQNKLDETLKIYALLLDHGVQSPEVHYNIANALTKKGVLGAAVGHYKHALRLEPSETLAEDIRHNLGIVRGLLSERARKKHRILHIFDESPELGVAIGRAAPQTLLGLLVVGGALAALLLWGLSWYRREGDLKIWVALSLALALHLASAAWLWQAQRVESQVRYSVVTQEDAPLVPCVGVGETISLPEGLEVRTLRERPDGRWEVRLPNGRGGCMQSDALYGGHDGQG